MAYKKFRKMKVYEQSEYHYKSALAIMLKEQWFKELGFEFNTPICVKCEGGKLTITRAGEIVEDYSEATEISTMCVAEPKNRCRIYNGAW